MWKFSPWLTRLLWTHFQDQNQNQTHLNNSKSHIKIVGPTRLNACVVYLSNTLWILELHHNRIFSKFSTFSSKVNHGQIWSNLVNQTSKSLWINSKFSSCSSDMIYILLNIWSRLYLWVYYSSSLFWCVIFWFCSRAGRMITSFNLSKLASTYSKHNIIIARGISSLGASLFLLFGIICYLILLIDQLIKLITMLVIAQ